MRELIIDTIINSEIIEQLNTYLKGTITKKWGETIFDFDNDSGKGQIRCIDFDWGVSLLDYDVHFFEDLKITFSSAVSKPIEFIFVSEGSMSYVNSSENKSFEFERFQNIIISGNKNTKETYIFPHKTTVKVNFISVQKTKYAEKKNNNLTYLNQNMLSLFSTTDSKTVYEHFGNFNLKIADQVKQMNNTFDSGIVRTLSIEGQLNLIMAMQLLEHNNFESGNGLPESMSKEDIKKVHELSGYIIDNIAEPLSVASLAKRANLNTKKLQLGFKVLHSKSVNTYIREMKLEISRDYIKNTSDSISEIVYKIGFKSRSYFSKIFFEKYGILPTDYRKIVK